MEEQTAKRTKSSSSEMADGMMINEESGFLAEEIKQFSSIALSNLEKRLVGEMDTPIIPIYLRVQEQALARTYAESWLELDLADVDSQVKFSYADHLMSESNFPKVVRELVDYGCGVWKSKIMIAGGKFKRLPDSKFYKDQLCSDKIYMYDTVKRNWETYQMKDRRGGTPIVVVAEDRVFIFDGEPELARWDFDSPNWSDDDSDEEDKNMQTMYPLMRTQNYCEYFDFKSGSPTPFKYLPMKKLLNIPDLDGIVDYAVCPTKTMILIWASTTHIVSLDYISLEWELYLELDHMPMPIPIRNAKLNTKLFSAPYLISAFLVLEDFIFWKDYSAIYAFDLFEGITLPVYTFPDFETICSPQSHSFCHHFSLGSCYSSLVSIGKRRLCLISNTYKYQICFATFKVVIGMGANQVKNLHLVLDRAGCLKTPVVCVSHAFGISTS